jgi:hypothetical protein
VRKNRKVKMENLGKRNSRKVKNIFDTLPQEKLDTIANNQEELEIIELEEVLDGSPDLVTHSGSDSSMSLSKYFIVESEISECSESTVRQEMFKIGLRMKFNDYYLYYRFYRLYSNIQDLYRKGR